MINKNMDNKTKIPDDQPKEQPIYGPVPDERGSFLVQGLLKIVDPETGEILVNQRG